MSDHNAQIEVITKEGRTFVYNERMTYFVNLQGEQQIQPIGISDNILVPKFVTQAAIVTFKKLREFVNVLDIFRNNEQRLSGTKNQLFKQDKLFTKFRYKKYSNIDALVSFANNY